jgi:hypothetical protein
MKNLIYHDFEVCGASLVALFTLKIYRGEGMVLLAMNWKKGKPPDDFAGFAIEYREPGGDRFFTLKNRLSFIDHEPCANELSTWLSPIQKFRWVHLPRHAGLKGVFTYRVTPVFMNNSDELSYGEPQEADIILSRETYAEELNVAFTRGFVSSQAFVDRYGGEKAISRLLPSEASRGLSFTPSHPKAAEALAWMGFEARQAILELLDAAIAENAAQVRVIAYDLNEPEVLSRLLKLGTRLRIIIDDDDDHGKKDSAESQAARRLMASAGKQNVKRQHMGKLQHNKIIVVNGPTLKTALCGSTNFSWRGFYIQANNAIIIRGMNAIQPFLDAFAIYWRHYAKGDFGINGSAEWSDLGLENVDAKVCFSPHSGRNAVLGEIAGDIARKTTSTLLYSLAFLYQTEGSVRDAIERLTDNSNLFIYGISDKKVGGLELRKPNGNLATVFPSALSANLPEPFSMEPIGGKGNRMHHKFIVVDFDKPTARVYTGSFNFSTAADLHNGENLLLIKNRRVVIAYMIEAMRLFDHYHFRVAQRETRKAKTRLCLSKPPRTPNEKPWWSPYYTDPVKIKDRELFGNFEKA